MRGLALSLTVLVFLFGALERAKADLIVYDEFCYGDEARPLPGLGDGEGWNGAWDVVTTGDPENNWADYVPEGLEFGHLVTRCGKARVYALADYIHVKAVRQLGLEPPESPSPPDGYTIWGSYLWARRSYHSGGDWAESMSALLVNSPDNWDGWDKTAEFYAAGDGWTSHLGGVGIKGPKSRANQGELITDHEPYLVIFKVTGLGPNDPPINPSINEWILTLDQFRHFKPYPNGWLTEDELTLASVGTAEDQVWQKQPSPLIGSVPIDYPLNDFLGLMSYDGGITPVGMVNDFDELRIANGNGDDGLNKVTPIVPEPPTFVLTVVAVLALAAYARRKHRYG